jgi:hypothetical protein
METFANSGGTKRPAEGGEDSRRPGRRKKKKALDRGERGRSTIL